jgi:hypothetical protein
VRNAGFPSRRRGYEEGRNLGVDRLTGDAQGPRHLQLLSLASSHGALDLGCGLSYHSPYFCTPDQERLDTGPLGPAVMDPAHRAIMFTDIVGSTEMTARLGDVVATELIRAHDSLVRRRSPAMTGARSSISVTASWQLSTQLRRP